MAKVPLEQHFLHNGVSFVAQRRLFERMRQVVNPQMLAYTVVALPPDACTSTQ